MARSKTVNLGKPQVEQMGVEDLGRRTGVHRVSKQRQTDL